MNTERESTPDTATIQRGPRWTTAIAVALSVAVSVTASAAPVTLSVDIIEGGARWESIGSDAGSGLHINDAIFAGFDDAYDSVYGVKIGGTVHNPGNMADQSEVMAGNRVLGTAITGAEETINNLVVTQQFLFYRAQFTGSAMVRILVCLENPTGANINTTVELFGNLGSDGNTTTEATSNGNTTVEAADRWVVSSDQVPHDDPIVTNVYVGPGNPAVTASAITGQGGGVDVFSATFNVSVPANSTRYLMFFGQLSASIEEAIASTAMFDSLGAFLSQGAVCDLSQEQLDEILNWDGLSICGALNGTVWFDSNDNGIRDPNESLVQGVPVNLLSADGMTTLRSQLTDADGMYEFSAMGPTEYMVEFVIPQGAGLMFAKQNQGSDDSVDSDVDPATGRAAVTIMSELFSTIDAGIIFIDPLSGQPCGLCGPGMAAMMPMMVAGLVWMRRGQRRRIR